MNIPYALQDPDAYNVGAHFLLGHTHLKFTLLYERRLFSLFDELADRLGVQKVETAGDCYIVAAGILTLDAEGYSEV